MPMVPYKLAEEIIFKPGTNRCSGRIRDGKFLYYFPSQMKKEAVEKILANMRPRLEKRLKDAYYYYDFFHKNLSKICDTAGLREMAEMLYTRKYPALDFPLTIKFRRQKTVMGTYRRNKNGEVTIHINDFFKNAPEVCLEYIIAHELSHHHCPGHDKAFYAEISVLCPEQDWKRLIANEYLLLKEAKLL